MQRITILLMIGLFVFTTRAFVFPQSTDERTKATAESKAVEAGNKICPVSGEKISDVVASGMTPVTYEYEGKIYNFCCSACIEEFKKDPQKYIKKVEEELKTESKEEMREPSHRH